jgi:hypothetical protein
MAKQHLMSMAFRNDSLIAGIANMSDSLNKVKVNSGYLEQKQLSHDLAHAMEGEAEALTRHLPQPPQWRRHSVLLESMTAFHDLC